MRRVLPLALLLVPALARAQREPDPQQHEVDVNVDINVQTGGNAALFDARYTYTPSGVDRRDVVPPTARRFGRHPTAFWARIVHDGGSREQITGVRLGFILNPVDFLYVEGEGGVERDRTLFDEPSAGGREYGYFAARLRGGIG